MVVKHEGIDLTVDLCPSHKPLDRALFSTLTTAMGRVERPVPLAVAITGRWIFEHEADLRWLKGLIDSGAISVTWINHSFNHTVAKNQKIRSNFLLAKGTNLHHEILHNEVVMLRNGLTPSVFFRFPGLVSDPAVYDSVVAVGLIPVGTDAWLAKNQWPTDGSIVLVHGNGNEPLGVKRFIKLLKDKESSITSKSWLLMDLRETVVDSAQ
jgi:hypothetical protein